MKILGNRVLVSPLEKEQQEGFQTVEVQDSFVYKGKVEQVSDDYLKRNEFDRRSGFATNTDIKPGDTIIFAKYSPDTHEIEHEGKKYKSVKVNDIIAVL